jgi:hypothetical protein
MLDGYRGDGCGGGRRRWQPLGSGVRGVSGEFSDSRWSIPRLHISAMLISL